MRLPYLDEQKLQILHPRWVGMIRRADRGMSHGLIVRRVNWIEKLRRRLWDLPGHVTEKRYTQTDEGKLKNDTPKPTTIDFLMNVVVSTVSFSKGDFRVGN